jgi:hypothetical protein
MKHKILIPLIVLFLCLGNKVYGHNNNDMNNNDSTKRIALEVEIESPILASLKIEKKGKKLYATVTLFNDSDKDVKLNEDKLGGDNLTEEVFFLKTFPLSPNLTFSPYVPLFKRDKEKYITLKAKEQMVTTTELTKYYDLKERKYEKLYIIFLVEMSHIDEENKPIMGRDKYGNILPVIFAFWTKDVILSKEDIEDLL